MFCSVLCCGVWWFEERPRGLEVLKLHWISAKTRVEERREKPEKTLNYWSLSRWFIPKWIITLCLVFIPSLIGNSLNWIANLLSRKTNLMSWITDSVEPVVRHWILRVKSVCGDCAKIWTLIDGVVWWWWCFMTLWFCFYFVCIVQFLLVFVSRFWGLFGW